jgi:hypothetical protein
MAHVSVRERRSRAVGDLLDELVTQFATSFGRVEMSPLGSVGVQVQDDLAAAIPAICEEPDERVDQDASTRGTQMGRASNPLFLAVDVVQTLSAA